jgi:ATP synthase in type III secretion protein N
MTPTIDLLASALRKGDDVRVTGRLRSVVGLCLRADVPDVRLGELCEIARRDDAPLLAEVVGFDAQGVTLLPLGEATGLAPDDAITPLRKALSVTFSDGLLGRVLDGLGRPIDGGAAIRGAERAVVAAAPEALRRKTIDTPLPLGVRALDALCTIGEGQRVGLFAAAGVGKSTLLGQIARHSAADVCVVCLVGERGREVVEFLDEQLGEAGRARSVLVCATSDAPALVRMKCPLVATTIAEGFRDQGKRVLLVMDSVTRFARAARDVGLSTGELPVRRGFPPSVFAALPNLLERAGRTERGSITALYTVLVEGDDHDEPIADELRGLLDGHVTLSRALASRGRYPAIDVPRSLSRAFPKLASPEHARAAAELRAALANYEDKRDLVLLGAYRAGSDALLDATLARLPALEAFLSQARDERPTLDQSVQALQALSRRAETR